jgi:hypothetical protein
MEVTCSSETSVDFQWITWHYTPEENLKSYKQLLLLMTRIKKVREVKLSEVGGQLHAPAALTLRK